jgi:hypothetical protein
MPLSGEVAANTYAPLMAGLDPAIQQTVSSIDWITGSRALRRGPVMRDQLKL